MSDEWDVKICCMGAGYVGGPTMAVIAKHCPKVRPTIHRGTMIFFESGTNIADLEAIWGNK